jgi:peptidoglycan/xylan/chitin deacetylase (PgdA/CDA1 family)
MNDLVILCYHGVSDSWPAPTTVRLSDFEAQLSALVARDYHGATLSEALIAPPHERTMVVTFDDAHRSVFERAAPVMERLGIPGTVYVPTEYPGSNRPMAWDGYDIWLGTAHEPELACMGWDQLRELVGRGWEVGSHTRSHPRLTQQADAEVAAELGDSRRECEARIGARCLSIAYPYSDCDDRVARAARDAGYMLGVTVPREPCALTPLRWPRVGVYRGESARRMMLRAWTRRLSPSIPARAALALRALGR